MRIEVDLTQNPDLKPENMHLNDPSCNATYHNKTYVLFDMIPVNGCGTKHDQSDPADIIYSNIAHWDPPRSNHSMIRTPGFRAVIRCSFPSAGRDDTSVKLAPAGMF